MGMTRPLGVMGIEVTTYHHMDGRASALSILDDTAQDDEDGERYKKNMKVVECISATRIDIKLVFILKNSLSSNRKIALNINAKALHTQHPYDGLAGSQVDGNQSPGCRHAVWFHREQRWQGCS